jgi:hypothetical protein
MKPNPSRTIGVFALLACFLVAPLPLRAQKAEPMPEPGPGWQERAAKMEAELKQMQEEAAKNPSRPSMAELRRELDEMAAERDAKLSRQDKAARLQWWLTGSFGLNLVLTLALLWTLLRRGGRPIRVTQA